MYTLLTDCSLFSLDVGGSGSLSDGEPEGLAQGGRHRVTDLPVLLNRGSVKLVGVGKALAPGALSDRHNPARMQCNVMHNKNNNKIADLFCSGCMTLPCFPIGSGLVMVVEK